MQALKKFYFGKSKFKPFISTWKTDNLSTGSSTATQVKLPLVSTGSYNFVVEWGDGTQNTITTWNQAQVTKTYSVAGTYQITIKGKCIGWVFNNTGDRLKILSIQQWGSFNLGTNQGAYFSGCANLNLSGVTDLLNLSGTITLARLFQGCTSLTTINRINEWNLIGVTSIQSIFESCSNFNQSINNWDVSTVNSMGGLFANASKFNQPLNLWNTSSVNNFNSTFLGASLFNQNISSWNTTSGNNFVGMFSGATNFNQDIGSWNTSKATNMSSMFHSATNFNQNIGSWNVSNVTNFVNFMVTKTPATFSAANLDAIYNGWSSRPVKTPITISFGTAKYTAAGVAGRAILTGAPNNWSIVDGGI